MLAEVVERRDDPHLAYVDGLGLYGPADAERLPLPDNLHPDAETHRLIGERFARALVTWPTLLSRPRVGAMARYGAQFGPDITFLGVPACDLDDPATYADADVVVVGAPFDGGTSHRPGTRFGPQAIRMTDYLPHDGSRPSPRAAHRRAAGPPRGRRRRRRDAARRHRARPRPCSRPRSRRSPAPARSRSSSAATTRSPTPDAKGVANVLGHGRVSMIHFDAHADTGDIEFGSLWGHGQPMRRLIESGALRGDRFLQVGLRGYWPGARDARLDGRAAACGPTR